MCKVPVCASANAARNLKRKVNKQLPQYLSIRKIKVPTRRSKHSDEVIEREMHVLDPEPLLKELRELDPRLIFGDETPAAQREF